MAASELLAVAEVAVVEGVAGSRTEKPLELQRTMRIRGGKREQMQRIRKKKRCGKKIISVWDTVCVLWLAKKKCEKKKKKKGTEGCVKSW